MSDQLNFTAEVELQAAEKDRQPRVAITAYMRHESIETTMRYYVGRNAESVATAVWESVAASGGAAEIGQILPPEQEPQVGNS